MTGQGPLRTALRPPSGIGRLLSKAVLTDNSILVGYSLMDLNRHETSAKH